MTAGRGEVRGGHMSKKEKGLMVMDHSVVTARGRGYKGTKWKWEKYNED